MNNPDTGNKILASTVTSTTTGSNCAAGSTDPRCAVSVPVSVLTITATPSTTSTTPGGTVGYTITVTNTGQSAYTGATFTDPLTGVLDDAGYNGDATATAGSVSYASPNLTWTGNLAVGATATITFSVTVNNLLGTAVLLLPYHHPVVLAKRLATIDVLSEGRMRLLTVGLGSLPGEAAAVGVDFAARGRRADEAIDVLRLLWAGDENGVSFEGEFFSFTNLCSFPKPRDTRTLPVHVGGSSAAAARRAGRRGDGYFPGGRLTAAERARRVELMRTTAAEAGRDPDALEDTRWGSIDLTAADVESVALDGTTPLIVNTSSPDPAEQRGQISAFADRLRLTS